MYLLSTIVAVSIFNTLNFYARVKSHLSITAAVLEYFEFNCILTFTIQLYTFICINAINEHSLISTWRIPFSISCKAGLVVINSLCFCLPEKDFISPCLGDIFARYTILGLQGFFFFQNFEYISSHSLLVYKVSAKKSTDILMRFLLYIMSCFLLLLSKFSVFDFWEFDYNMFAVVVQWLSHVQLFEISWAAAHQASLSFTVFWSLLIFMSTQLVMLSSHFILLLLPSIFSRIRIFSNELALCIRWPKYSMFGFNLLLVDPVLWSEFPRSGCCDLEFQLLYF